MRSGGKKKKRFSKTAARVKLKAMNLLISSAPPPVIFHFSEERSKDTSNEETDRITMAVKVQSVQQPVTIKERNEIRF